jgi:hypothetical protein
MSPDKYFRSGQVRADADQWKKNGPALREVIDSMDM